MPEPAGQAASSPIPRIGENRREPTFLQRIADSDVTAVEDFIDRYGRVVWWLARKYAKTSDDAEDAVQEIFLDLWQHAARFDPKKSSETAFVALIARRRLIDRRRKNSRRLQCHDSDEAEAVCPKNSEREMQIRLDAKKVLLVLDQLDSRQIVVINLSIFEGMSHPEIAARTGLPLGTVKTLIRRGFQRLRYLLGVGNNGFSNA